MSEWLSPHRQPILLVLVILALFVAGCSQDGANGNRRDLGEGPAEALQAAAATTTTALTVSGTATDTPTATASPTPTNTPTPTPTPTATALPAQIDGDPRSYALGPAEAQPGAVCGVVDVFDFPVDPPDALNVGRGGTDYNRYRERYNGFHAGEDWGGPNGRRVGTPVYSIGHGRVIYAHPHGWGVDLGTVIVRHVLPDGSQILSFYGHLDPPSVDFSYGECVARGEKVGEIGDPRGRPHLHFEIRTHMPAEPGPGYWSVDPTLAGWFPPSVTIWESRYQASPGIVWARPPSREDAFTGTKATGFLPGDVLVLLEAGRLRGVGLADGRTQWTQPSPPTPTPQPEATPDPTRIAREVEAAAPVRAALDEVEPIVYTVDSRQRMQAYSTAGETPAFEPLWQVELEVTGPPALAPLPGGGITVVGRREVVALDAGGRELWRQALEGIPGDPVRAGDHLFLPVGRDDLTLWVLAAEGATEWVGLPGGTPVGRPGGQLWLYARDAVYRLNPSVPSAELVMTLPPALFGAGAHGSGDAVALADGGLLVAHPDAADGRLLRFDASGGLLWERSYRAAGEGAARLALSGDQAYLTLIEDGSTMMVAVYAVALETGNLVRLFEGGTREGMSRNTWLLPTAGSALLVNIGGGHLVALDPAAAQEALAGGTAAAPEP